MRLSVIGCGYLGAVHAASMAVLGHEVVGVDLDADKVDALNRAQAPFFEPGLSEVLAQGIASGRLTFTTDMASLMVRASTSCASAPLRSAASMPPTWPT